MVLCVAVGCSSKSRKHKGFKLFRIPKFITNQGEEQEKLTTTRRNDRISTVSKEATNKKLESARGRVNEFVAITSL